MKILGYSFRCLPAIWRRLSGPCNIHLPWRASDVSNVMIVVVPRSASLDLIFPVTVEPGYCGAAVGNTAPAAPSVAVIDPVSVVIVPLLPSLFSENVVFLPLLSVMVVSFLDPHPATLTANPAQIIRWRITIFLLVVGTSLRSLSAPGKSVNRIDASRRNTIRVSSVLCRKWFANNDLEIVGVANQPHTDLDRSSRYEKAIMTNDPQNNQNLPKFAHVLGYAGIFPQAFLLILSLNSSLGYIAVLVGFFYAAVIFSFLGGIWWGLAAALPNPPSWAYGAAVLPSLLAVAAGIPLLLGAIGPAISLFAIGFAIMGSLLVDRRMNQLGLMGGDLFSLRVKLSLGLGVLTLALGLLA
jgi:hypothetical protein